MPRPQFLASRSKRQKLSIKMLALNSIIIGMGATAVFDLFGVLKSLIFNLPLPNMNLLGRWVGHFPNGTFAHTSIKAAETIPGEFYIGWSTHYLVGCLFAFIFLLIVGKRWVLRPTLYSALAFGFATVIAPFLIMHPAMGAGFASSMTPDPEAARFKSLTNHFVFGVGLYAAAWSSHRLSSLFSRSEAQ